MSETIDAELEKLARAADEDVTCSEVVEQVEMRRGIDALDRPAYRFSSLIDQSRARERPGRIRIGIMGRVLDALDARGDEHRPILRILSREEWDRRSDVGFY
jgi:hypothetical protein